MLFRSLAKNHPTLIEDDYFRPHDTAVISIPQKAPAGAILRTESPFQLLDRIKKVATEWVRTGHRRGSNTHNVSATISLKENEWETAGEWSRKKKKGPVRAKKTTVDGIQFASGLEAYISVG